MGQIRNSGLRSQGGRQMNDFNGEDTSGGRDKGNLAKGIREGREQLLSILSAMARDQVSVLHVGSFAAVRKHNDAGHSTEAIDEENIQVRRGVTRNYILSKWTSGHGRVENFTYPACSEHPFALRAVFNHDTRRTYGSEGLRHC